MTHADLLVQLIAEYGRTSIEDARAILAHFVSAFPVPLRLETRLTSEEAQAILELVQIDSALLCWIAQVMIHYGRTHPAS